MGHFPGLFAGLCRSNSQGEFPLSTIVESLDVGSPHVQVQALGSRLQQRIDQLFLPQRAAAAVPGGWLLVLTPRAEDPQG